MNFDLFRIDERVERISSVGLISGDNDFCNMKQCSGACLSKDDGNGNENATIKTAGFMTNNNNSCMLCTYILHVGTFLCRSVKNNNVK